jgi:coproporphyrinogen III oxidase
MNYELIVPAVQDYLLQLQASVCFALEKEDRQKKFIADDWRHTEKGGGKTCVLAEGPLIERAAVNFSHISGVNLPPSATARHSPLLKTIPFQAMGLSLVVHPRNPYVPTTHMNLRLITLKQTHTHDPIWWFGGGFDLTPYYAFAEDCQHWHRTAKLACDPFGRDVYAQYKKNCDDYFYLKHRKEWRGIGGIFFDDVHHWDFQTCFAFIRSVGDHFLSAYLPILQRHKKTPYGERERQFQAYRRGRYVEFNLIYDRGTLFGLQSGGRIESILTSMPPQASWQYNWQGEQDSPESQLIEKFLTPQEWIL